jgi:prolipoprotein diacylglyceryltransferase
VSFPYYSSAYLDQFADKERPLPAPTALIETNPETGEPRPIAPEHLKAMGPQFVKLAAGQRSRSVHPAQLYSTITAWLLAAVLLAYFTLPHAPGRAFALMMILEGASRYLLEWLRTEPPVVGQFSLSMIIGLGLVGGGIILWVVFGRFQRGDAVGGTT